MRPEPPAGTLMRDGNAGMIWRHGGAGQWTTEGPVTWCATWEELDGGKYGPLELLVPVAYDTEVAAGTPGAAIAQRLVEAVLNPVGTMMQQLAQAAGGGITAVVLDAYKRGQADAHTVERGDPSVPPSGPGDCGQDDCQHAPDGGNHPAAGGAHG